MYLSILKLWNFRQFGSNDPLLDISKPHFEVSFTKGLNVLIGENDSGKSAVIDAIRYVLKTHSFESYRIEEHDFHYHKELNTATTPATIDYFIAQRFRIELKLEGFEDNEAKNFTEWLEWDTVSNTPYLRLFLDVSKSGDRIRPSDVRAGIETGSALDAEAREYLKSTYLKPLRDAENELMAKKYSRLSQILLADPIFKNADESHELIKSFKKLKTEIDEFFRETPQTTQSQLVVQAPQQTSIKGTQIKSKIDAYIHDFLGDDKNSSFESNIDQLSIRNVLEKLSLMLESGVNFGLGTLNRLFMAAELLHLQQENWTGLRLALVEELEAHLHPQAQMLVIESLQKKDDVQMILTSHSPNLTSKVKLEHLILFHNKKAYPLGKDHTKLKPADYPFLERFLDVTKANLFFAKGIILVEGAAEELLIPALANKLKALGEINKSLIQAQISVVAIHNTAFHRYANIFKRKNSQGMSVKVAVINDLDWRPTEYASKLVPIVDPIKYKEKKIIDSSTDIQTLKSDKEKSFDDQSVKAFISEKWTLEYCLALHPELRKILFHAIYKAKEENRADNTESLNPDFQEIREIPFPQSEWDAYINGKSIEQVAIEIMFDYIVDGKKLSKAVIAKYLAELIDTDTALNSNNLLITNNPISYLIEAIKYVAN